jgi:urease accessory protein
MTTTSSGRSGRQPAESGQWQAELRLEFARRGAGTELVREHHRGPLLVQKTLHPEGPDPCHAIVLHPPSGIVGGDQLSLEVRTGARAAVLLTTPGAAKWYRTTGPRASMATHLEVAEGAVLEYLPREAIVFDGARARATLEVDLGTGARALGWDVWCLGRTASGERFDSGRLELATRLRREGRLCWEERGAFDGGAPLLQARAGFAGEPVFATLWATGAPISRATLDACRTLPIAGGGRGAVTELPDILLARYLGPSTEEALAWFTALWALLRPAIADREAVRPRIWTV